MNTCPSCRRQFGRTARHACPADSQAEGRHGHGYVPEPRPYSPTHCACDDCWDADLRAAMWGDTAAVTDHIAETVAAR